MTIGIGSALVGDVSAELIVVVGPVMLIMISCADEAGDTFPAASSCVAVRECVPACSVEVVIDHAPLATVSVPTAESRLDVSVINSPLTPVPVIVGVWSLVGDVGASIVGAADSV